MRQVVLDTETTGLEASQGHRIIEIGCVEIINRRIERTWHKYLQPDREIDAAAVEIHGITTELLADKPRFAEVAAELLDFIRGAELIIHNASFDIAFIDAELARTGGGGVRDICSILDTLELARKLHPGQKNNLDALCKRYSVDNADREVHGALLDARILAEVYLAMTGGQTSLALASDAQPTEQGSDAAALVPTMRPLRIIKADSHELEAHAMRLQEIDKISGGKCLWLRRNTE
jgi:DNA polymerase-3 subunit epsilon